MRVYHLISRNQHGLMIQILAGLITYLLLSLYCKEFNEKVTLKRLRAIQIQIANELRQGKVINFGEDDSVPEPVPDETQMLANL